MNYTKFGWKYFQLLKKKQLKRTLLKYWFTGGISERVI